MENIEKQQLYMATNPIDEFSTLNRNQCDKNSRSVMFTRVSGYVDSIERYMEKLSNICNELEGKSFVLIQNELVREFSTSEVEKAKIVYENFHLSNQSIQNQVSTAINQAMSFYKKAYPNDNDTMLKNLAIKLVLWIERYGAELFNYTNNKGRSKVLYYGGLKKHEVCFLHVLWLAGCDVLCVNPSKDPMEGLLAYHSQSQGVTLADRTADIPMLNIKQKTVAPIIGKDYSTEEISQLSDAVVMIKVYDDQGCVIKSGSGVVISSKGYIITNFHVVAGSNRFVVIFENDDKEYPSEQIIKYHQLFDVALIQVNRMGKYLPLSKKTTVRGQKIVAIGSPLGLFNTISEGIISGFRNFEDVEMLQFSAPISSGSSGGALINIKGELVGITTAGFEGQNLNLAIPCSYLELFAGNFME